MKSKINSKLNYKEICSLIMRNEGFTLEELRRSCRYGEMNFTRQLCMYLALEFTDVTLTEIAGYFGRSNHATAINARQSIRNYFDTDKAKRVKIQNYEKFIEREETYPEKTLQ